MGYLIKLPVPNPAEFPGATFKVHDPIPLTECRTGVPAIPTTVQEICIVAKEIGKAYTILNGRLYTDMTNAQMASHCANTYAPQTL